MAKWAPGLAWSGPHSLLECSAGHRVSSRAGRGPLGVGQEQSPPTCSPWDTVTGHCDTLGQCAQCSKGVTRGQIHSWQEPAQTWLSGGERPTRPTSDPHPHSREDSKVKSQFWRDGVSGDSVRVGRKGAALGTVGLLTPPPSSVQPSLLPWCCWSARPAFTSSRPPPPARSPGTPILTVTRTVPEHPELHTLKITRLCKELHLV